MKPPPCQLAATVEVPVARSSTAITLSPGLPAPFSVADQEIMVWVTSWGARAALPVIEQMVRPALNDERLVVRYQPIIDISTGHVARVEALVRIHGNDGVVSRTGSSTWLRRPAC